MALGLLQALREPEKNPLLTSGAARKQPPGQGQKNKTKMLLFLSTSLKAAAFCAPPPSITACSIGQGAGPITALIEHLVLEAEGTQVGGREAHTTLCPSPNTIPMETTQGLILSSPRHGSSASRPMHLPPS